MIKKKNNEKIYEIPHPFGVRKDIRASPPRRFAVQWAAKKCGQSLFFRLTFGSFGQAKEQEKTAL